MSRTSVCACVWVVHVVIVEVYKHDTVWQSMHFKVCTSKVCTAKVCTSKVCTSKVCTSKVCTSKVGANSYCFWGDLSQKCFALQKIQFINEALRRHLSFSLSLHKMHIYVQVRSETNVAFRALPDLTSFVISNSWKKPENSTPSRYSWIQQRTDRVTASCIHFYLKSFDLWT